MGEVESVAATPPPRQAASPEVLVPKAADPAAATMEVTDEEDNDLASYHPSELHDVGVENEVRDVVGKLDERAMQKLLAEIKTQQKDNLELYSRALRDEAGVAEEDWSFGADDCFEDIVGFLVWAKMKDAREQIPAPLAELPVPVEKAPSAPPVPPSLGGAQDASASGKAPVPVAAARQVVPLQPPPAPVPVASAKGPPSPPTMAPAPVPDLPSKALPVPVQPKVEAVPQAHAVPARLEVAAPKADPVCVQPTVEATPAPKAQTGGDGGQVVPKAALPAGQMLPPPVPPAKLSGEVSKVAANVKEDPKQLPNSVTHRKEWMAYCRMAKNPSKMQGSLQPMFATQSGKLDLFRIWLQRGQNFLECEIEVKRRQVQENSAKSVESALSRAQLLADGRYTTEDIDDLIRRRTDSGDYINDPNFPDRKDLRRYILNTELTRTKTDLRSAETSLSSKARVETSEAMALTEEGSDFSHASTSAPTFASLLGAVTAPTPVDPVAKPKPRTRKGKKEQEAGNGEPVPVVPPTPLEKANLTKKAVTLGQYSKFLFLNLS